MLRRGPLGNRNITKDAGWLRAILNSTPQPAPEGGGSDHGALSGLADDDHDQYTLGPPDTLTVSTSNNEGATHTHAITASPNPGVAASILRTNTFGQLFLEGDFVVDSDTLWVDVSEDSVYVNAVPVPTRTGALVVHPATVNQQGFVLEGKSGQVADLFLVYDSSGNALVVLTNDGDLESGTPAFAKGISGWQLTPDGDAEFNNVDVRGSIRASVFEYGDIQATAGTLLVSKSAAKLEADWTSPGSVGSSNTMSVANDTAGTWLFAVSDILRIKTLQPTGVAQVWLEVMGRTDQGDYTDYTVKLRNGDTSTLFRKGTGIADYGQSGDGLIYLSADGIVGASANISISDHLGSPWSSETLKVRIGNMNGSYDTGSNDRYGFGVGDKSSGNYMSYNAEVANQFILKAGNGVVALDETGLSIKGGTGSTWLASKGINWTDDAGNPSSRIWAFENSTKRQVIIDFDQTADTKDRGWEVNCVGPTTGEYGSASLRARSGVSGNEARVSAYAAIGTDGVVELVGNVYADDALYVDEAIYAGKEYGIILKSAQDVTPDKEDIWWYWGSTRVGQLGSDDANWFRINQNTAIPIYSPQHIYSGPGFRAGNAAPVPVNGDLTYADALIKDHLGSDRIGKIYVPITPDIQGISWWATAKTTGGTTITVNTTFPGIPSSVTALNLRVMARDSATHPTTTPYLIVGPDSTTNDNVGVHCGGDSVISQNTGICNVSSNTIYAYLVNSGTMHCWLAVLGYWI